MPIASFATKLPILLVTLALALDANAQPEIVLPEASHVLADYVKRPDPSYAWHVLRRGKQGSGEYAELLLTSQTWHDIVWKHQLFIYRPAKVRDASQALLLIDGGNWSDALEHDSNEAKPAELPEKVHLIMMLADMMETPVAIVRQVPEQPMFDGRKEDQIIALTFAKYFATGESDWPLLLPMVKATSRAMDAVQAFSKQEWQLDIQHFLVTGASKRGWTTWLTAATDPRVNALAPMVINMLNMVAHDELQLASFGKYSEQIRDYTDSGLHQRLLTEQGAALRAIVDPIAYRATLIQPKLVILATNDPYWPVDALNLYWNELSGEKYILYMPNNVHSIQDYPRVAATVAALERSLSGDKPMPKLEWHINEKTNPSKLELTVDKRPIAVQQCVATAETRDFRQSVWKSTRVLANEGDDHKFAIELTAPTHGFGAYFLEAEFPDETAPFVLTTTLHVVGNAVPTSGGAGSE